MVIGEIDTKTSSDLTISGATVTVPAGYYASTALKSVSTATQATPNITVNSSGLITATATQSAGYVFSGTKSATKQLTTQGAQTITPTTTNQTISSGKYLTGTQTVKGDANLIAANIAEGKTIFGVTGTYTGGVDTSDATATADKIFLDETAYVNGEKVTGSFTIDDELTAQDSLITQIASTLVGNKAVSSSGTCTVIIAGFTGWNSSNNDVIRYSCVKNGEIVVEEIDMIPIFPDDVPYTFLENVVCNSIIEYRYDGDSDEVNYLDIVADDSITIFYQKIDTEVHVLFSASANGTIRFDEWD